MALLLYDKKKLRTEYELLYLIYHRNKNQHGCTSWFKYLNMLIRHLRKLLMSDSVKLQKLSFRHLNKHVIPKLYYAFNGIIAQGQFITLGLSLVGSLAKVYSITCILDEEKPMLIPPNVVQQSSADADQDVGEEVDLGELVELKKRAATEPIEERVPKKNKASHQKTENVTFTRELEKKDKKDKKKKKKKKSLIDDIFG